MLNWRRHRSEHLAEEDVSAYLDGELRGRRQARAGDHIESCERCQTRLEELRSLKMMLAGLPRAAPSRSLLLAPQQAGRAALRRAARRPVFAFAPAVALSLLAALLFVDLAVLDDGASQTAGRTAGAPAATKSLARESATQERARQPPSGGAAPQPGAAATGAFGAAETNRSPIAATPAVAVAPTSDSPERRADATAESDAGSDTRDVVRALEVAVGAVFIVTLLVFLRQRLFRRGDL